MLLPVLLLVPTLCPLNHVLSNHNVNQGLNQKFSDFKTSCCLVQDHVAGGALPSFAIFAPRRPSHLLTGPHLLLLGGGAQHRAQLCPAAGMWQIKPAQILDKIRPSYRQNPPN